VPFEKKDLDIVRLANFGKCKRQFALFKALRDTPRSVKVVCIGQHPDPQLLRSEDRAMMRATYDDIRTNMRHRRSTITNESHPELAQAIR
jgi:hypothetical protein